MPNNTPTCPGCGAKFAHSNAMKACTRCGLPDDVVSQGEGAVARWKKERERQAALDAGMTKSERKKARWGSRERRQHKKRHGRPV